MVVITRISPSIIATVEVADDANVTENQILQTLQNSHDLKLSDTELSQWAYRLCNYGDETSIAFHVQESIAFEWNIQSEVSVTFSYSPEEA
jgi:hypothetical protein